MEPARHVPVLLSEVIEALAPRPGETYADCTAGLGGHAAVCSAQLGPGGTVVLNDLDPANLERAQAAVMAAGSGARVQAVLGNFADLPRTVGELGLRADMVLADLGFSSPQVDDGERGFSFSRPGPLDMRYGRSGPTAADLVNTLSERELASTFWEFGEERYSRRVAAEIVRARADAPIRTTDQLAELCRRVVPRSADGLDPATRSFQALRILVNDELGALDALLVAVEQGARSAIEGRPSWLAPGARVALISFHSLEDRRVKRAMARWAELGLVARRGEEGSRRAPDHRTRGGGSGQRPVVAGDLECTTNPRSRSAKLRIARIARRSGIN